MKKHRRRREAKKKRRAARAAELDAARTGESHMPFFARAIIAETGRPRLRLVQGGRADEEDGAPGATES